MDYNGITPPIPSLQSIEALPLALIQKGALYGSVPALRTPQRGGGEGGAGPELRARRRMPAKPAGCARARRHCTGADAAPPTETECRPQQPQPLQLTKRRHLKRLGTLLKTQDEKDTDIGTRDDDLSYFFQ